MASKTSRLGLVLGAVLPLLGASGCGLDADTDTPRFEATFTLVDGSRVEVEVESRVVTDPASWICSGTNALDEYGFSVSLHFPPWRLPAPGVYDLAETYDDHDLYLMVIWEIDEGYQLTFAGNGTLEIFEIGVEPGDAIIASFSDVDMKPDADDPHDVLARIDDGFFYCVAR